MDRIIFDTCVKLKDAGLYQSRRPDDYYYITPEVVVRMDDLSDLRNPYSHFSDFNFQNIVFQPSLNDLLFNVQVSQLVKTVDSAWIAYQDNSEGKSYRAQGNTPWLAIADLFLGIVKDNKKTIPDVDAGTLDESNSITLTNKKSILDAPDIITPLTKKSL